MNCNITWWSGISSNPYYLFLIWIYLEVKCIKNSRYIHTSDFNLIWTGGSSSFVILALPMCSNIELEHITHLPPLCEITCSVFSWKRKNVPSSHPELASKPGEECATLHSYLDPIIGSGHEHPQRAIYNPPDNVLSSICHLKLRMSSVRLSPDRPTRWDQGSYAERSSVKLWS
jgi:hypothetical protein